MMRPNLVTLSGLASLANAHFWLESIGHVGTAPYNPDPTYRVFRNVKDFGAKGDGGAFLRLFRP